MVDVLFGLIQQFISSYGIAAVFFVGFLEEVIFIIPSSLVFLAAGFFLVDAGLPLGAAISMIAIKVAWWGSLGVTIGSYAIYALFYWGGKAAVGKYGRYLGIGWESITKLERRFAKGHADELVLFLLRAMPIWSMTLVSAFAGLIRLPWKEFGLYTFLGTMVRLFLLGFLGWKLGAAYYHWAGWLEKAQIYGSIILLGLFVVFLIYVFRRRREN